MNTLSVLPSDLRISTMTQTARLSSEVNLSELFNHLEPSETIEYIEYGDKPPKGQRAKPKKKSKASVHPEKPTKRKKYFYNQVTIHLNHHKIINMKVFNNGGIQMTGIKYPEQGSESIQILLGLIRKLPGPVRNIVFTDELNPKVEWIKNVMINSDFDIGFRVDRETLHRSIVEDGYYSSYEPVIYPGVNIKYYYNPKIQQSGICNCKDMCDGKGHGTTCKKITVAVFNSGKIMITGGNSTEHVGKAYEFITNFIVRKKDIIELK